jgi:hypothetical protein
MQGSITEDLSQQRDGESALVIDFRCPDRSFCGRLLFSAGGILRTIWIPIRYELRIQTAVTLRGEPSSLESGLYHPEAGGCDLRLVWSDLEVIAESLDTDERANCEAAERGESIPSSVRITYVTYTADDLALEEPLPTFVRVSWPGLSDE